MSPLVLVLLVGVLWWSAGSAAAEGPVTVTFQTSPRGAMVSCTPGWRVLGDGTRVLSTQESDWGPSGVPLTLDLTGLNPREELRLRFRLEGFVDEERRLRVEELTGPSFPAGGPIDLKPKTIRAFLRKYPQAAVGAVLALLAGLALWGYQRRVAERLRRAQHLERFRAESGGDGSLVLTRLGSYRLVEKLGAGGMASVYRALPDADLEGESVAIKVMRRDVSDNLEFRRRFEREIRVSSQLDHPSIVRILDWGWEDTGLTYLAMELVRGHDLRRRLDQGPVAPAEALSIMVPLMEAVHYAHGQGVVHRDLKPENLMITEKGRIKVLDFGMAWAVDQESLTKTGSVLGTPAYMAPEHVEGKRFDPAMDQYAIGIIAYEILTNQRPFAEEDAVQTIFSKLTRPPIPLSRWRDDVPDGLEKVIMTMIARNSQERFPDVASARVALEKSLRAWSGTLKSQT